jgi:hypothetical protein
MVIVADTSPINYLVLIGHIGILPRLYTRVVIPPAVFDELTHPAAPAPVRDWIERHPAWLEVLSPKSTIAVAQLDLGESQAIACGKPVSVYLRPFWNKLSEGALADAHAAFDWVRCHGANRGGRSRTPIPFGKPRS